MCLLVRALSGPWVSASVGVCLCVCVCDIPGLLVCVFLCECVCVCVCLCMYVCLRIGLSQCIFVICVAIMRDEHLYASHLLL